VTTDISIRELCRRHDISAHSVVVGQTRTRSGRRSARPTGRRSRRSAWRSTLLDMPTTSMRPSPSSAPTVCDEAGHAACSSR